MSEKTGGMASKTAGRLRDGQPHVDSGTGF